MAHIRRDLMFRVILAHEMDRIPVILVKLDVLLIGEPCGELFIPGRRVDQISFLIDVR
jgi:hypothetical protein